MDYQIDEPRDPYYTDPSRCDGCGERDCACGGTWEVRQRMSPHPLATCESCGRTLDRTCYEIDTRDTGWFACSARCVDDIRRDLVRYAP